MSKLVKFFQPVAAGLFLTLWSTAHVTAAPLTHEVGIASQEAGVFLRAYWTAPAGQTKAPAVIALHGCSGLPQDRSTLNYAQNRYIRIFHDLGIGVLYLDSFGERGLTSICEQKPSERMLTEANRRQDVLAALQWLAAQTLVDADKLAVVGWSHGGQTVLAIADHRADGAPSAGIRPAALVAFYPGCSAFQKNQSYSLWAPLLIMSGELDNWTPASSCRSLTERLYSAKQPVNYVQYPGSYHAFDSNAPVVERDNVGGTKSGKAMVGGNPRARIASARDMVLFLSRELSFPVDLSVLDDTVHAAKVPSPSGFSLLTNVDSLPRITARGKALYREWLEKPFPRAVALSEKGAIARGYGRTAMETAIKNCEKFGNPCRLYAVDDQVVWPHP